jgi:hypothetical protein
MKKDIELIEEVKEALPNFKQSASSPFLYYGPLRGAKTGLVFASKKPPFDTYALNTNDLVKRLLPAKASGKFAEGYVVLVKVTAGGHVRNGEIVDVKEAEAVFETLKDTPTRTGAYGEFWTLTDEDDDPFADAAAE